MEEFHVKNKNEAIEIASKWYDIILKEVYDNDNIIVGPVAIYLPNSEDVILMKLDIRGVVTINMFLLNVNDIGKKELGMETFKEASFSVLKNKIPSIITKFWKLATYNNNKIAYELVKIAKKLIKE